MAGFNPSASEASQGHNSSESQIENHQSIGTNSRKKIYKISKACPPSEPCSMISMLYAKIKRLTIIAYFLCSHIKLKNIRLFKRYNNSPYKLGFSNAEDQASKLLLYKQGEHSTNAFERETAKSNFLAI